MMNLSEIAEGAGLCDLGGRGVDHRTGAGERMRGIRREGGEWSDTIILTTLAALIILITILDLGIWPRYYRALLYGIPLLLAAETLAAPWVFAVAAPYGLRTGAVVSFWDLLLLRVIVYGYLTRRR